MYREISDLYRFADLNRCAFTRVHFEVNEHEWSSLNEREIEIKKRKKKNVTIECLQRVVVVKMLMISGEYSLSYYLDFYFHFDHFHRKE